MARPRFILYLQTDEQRLDTLGHMNPRVRTPALDALAADGVSCREARVVNPSCVPSRAAIMTGLYPSECGAPTFITHLEPDTETFMNRLQNAGYYTACIGKQHINRGGEVPPGYDYAAVCDMHFPHQWFFEEQLDADRLNKGAGYPRFLRDAGVTSLDELWRRYPDDERHLCLEWIGESRLHIDAFIGERALQWIDNWAASGTDQPAYLTVSFPGPHQPLDINHGDLLDGWQHTPAAGSPDDLKHKPPHYLAKLEENQDGRFVSPEQQYHMRQHYDANVALIDRKIAAIIERLKQHGLYDDTLILFSSDHGDFMGDYGLEAKGQYLSDDLLRVPMIIKPPADAAGDCRQLEEELIESIDITAMILGSAGCNTDHCSGVDWSRAWRDPAGDKPERAYAVAEAGGIRMITDGRFKVISYHERDYGEAYDLQADPHELENLWDNGERRAERDALLAKLAEHRLGRCPYIDAKWNTNAPAI